MTNSLPPDWQTITSIDAHVAGEPLRVVTGGWPPVPGKSMLEKRRYAAERHDALRGALMLEPRGHADMYGCILTEPVTEDGDCGVLFMHNDGWSTMCGHGIIGLVKVAFDCELLTPRETLRIDTPAGRVTARAEIRDDAVTRVSFDNVPSFVLVAGFEVLVDGIGRVHGDVAFGGAFYAYVDADTVGLTLTTDYTRSIIDTGMRIKRAVAESIDIGHPLGRSDLDFLYGTIFVGDAQSEQAHSRNVCVFANGEVDRSPTGTGVSGRTAIHHARGDIDRETIRIESLIGTTFDVRVAETVDVAGRTAIVPEVSGQAFLIGRHEHWIDPSDPMRNGFLVR